MSLALVLDHTTAAVLHNPQHAVNQAVTQFYVEASHGLGTLHIPVACLIAADLERPGTMDDLLTMRFLRVEHLETAQAPAVAQLLRKGASWAVAHAAVAARPSASHPEGRVLVTLDPSLYAGLGVRAVTPD